jgi:hypothetical protein
MLTTGSQTVLVFKEIQFLGDWTRFNPDCDCSRLRAHALPSYCSSTLAVVYLFLVRGLKWRHRAMLRAMAPHDRAT